jgi:hypothetical protein
MCKNTGHLIRKFTLYPLKKSVLEHNESPFMKFGYARVSKNDQSPDIQIQKLCAAGCD